jgi:hypothetical protein
MANKSKRIGTEGENMVVERLQKAGFANAERRMGNTTARDIFGVPCVVEVKRTEQWTPQKWALHMTKHHGDEWALYMMPRDQRRVTAPPPVVMVPALYFEYLLSLHEDDIAPHPREYQ